MRRCRGFSCGLAFGLAAAAVAGEIVIPKLDGVIGNPRAPEEQVGFLDEHPAHLVLVYPYALSAREVTKAQWDAVRAWGLARGYDDLPEGVGGTATDPEEAAGHPVVGVSWLDAIKWCNALSEMNGILPAYWLDSQYRIAYRSGEADVLYPLVSKSGYRLPTEREWELAARGGASGQDYPWAGSSPFYLENISPAHARYEAEGTVPTGQYPSNGFGFFDMAGNVGEWCWDWFDAGWYGQIAGTANEFPDGPAAVPVDHAKVVRGGSWRSAAADLRVAARGLAQPDQRRDDLGFRVAQTLSPTSATAAIERFTATEEDGKVVLRWWVSGAEDAEGFWLCRDKGGTWVPVQWIPAAGGSEAAYVVVDSDALPGTEYRYRLEIAGSGDVLYEGPFDRVATILWFPGAIRRAAEGLELRWASRMDELYRVQRAADLFESFEPVSTALEATPPENVFVDPTPPPRAFYRIEMIAPPVPPP